MLEVLVNCGAPQHGSQGKDTREPEYRYAYKKGLCDRDPTALLEVTLPRSKPRPAVALKDLPALIKAIDGYGGDAVTKYALQLLDADVAAICELIGATWAEIDMAAAVWIVPESNEEKRPWRSCRSAEPPSARHPGTTQDDKRRQALHLRVRQEEPAHQQEHDFIRFVSPRLSSRDVRAWLPLNREHADK